MNVICNVARFFEYGKWNAYSQFTHVEDMGKLKECKPYILKRIEKVNLKPVVGKVFDFEDYKKAYEYMLSNEQVGKIVVRVTKK